MSLFRKLGEKFEETRQAFGEGRDEDGFRCESCGEALTQEYDTCPYCGEDAVEANN